MVGGRLRTVVGLIPWSMLCHGGSVMWPGKVLWCSSGFLADTGESIRAILALICLGLDGV